MFTKLLLLFTFFASVIVYPYKVQLDSKYFTLESGKDGLYGYVENDGNEIIALKLSVSELLQDKGAFEINEAKTKTFEPVPKKILLKPGQKQSIRIISKLKRSRKERKYYLTTSQIPIPSKKKDKSKSKIRFEVLSNYKITFYARSKRSRQSYKFKARKNTSGESTTIDLSLNNTGDTIILLKDLTVDLKAGSKEISIPGKALYDKFMQLFPNNEVKISIPWPQDFIESEKLSDYKFNFK